MNTTECEALTARFDKMATEGLVDVKFLLQNPDEATVDAVCREVSEMMDAFERGDSMPLNFGDSHTR